MERRPLELARRAHRDARRGRAGRAAPGVRLVFMGASQSPAGRRAADATRAVAAELGVLDSLVFFNEAWVPYERARELAARGGLRDLHPPRAPRDALRVPHAPARLLLGRRAGGLHAGRRPVGAGRTRGRGRRRARGDHARRRERARARADQGRAAYAPRLARVAESFAWPRVAEPLARFVAAGRPATSERRSRGGRHPAHAARAAGYRMGRATLNAVGLRDWPTL